MSARILTLAALLVATALGIAVAFDEMPAQVAAASTTGLPQTYQLHVLPGTSGQWLVLDTRSGEVHHWARVRNDYVVTSLRRGMTPTFGWKQEIVRPPSDTTR